MPVPDFDHNGVLPPHLGDPTDLTRLSPYPVSPVELCTKLGTTWERRAILSGLLNLRESLRTLQFTECFQWIDGSFMEDCEARRGRAPNDVDVVTFGRYSQVPVDPALAAIIRDHQQTKAQYRVDHFTVNLNWQSSALVEQARYWALLFSHSRGDSLWKGMVRLELGTAAGDDLARQALAAQAAPAPVNPTPPPAPPAPGNQAPPP